MWYYHIIISNHNNNILILIQIKQDYKSHHVKIFLIEKFVLVQVIICWTSIQQFFGRLFNIEGRSIVFLFLSCCSREQLARSSLLPSCFFLLVKLACFAISLLLVVARSVSIQVVSVNRLSPFFS